MIVRKLHSICLVLIGLYLFEAYPNRMYADDNPFDRINPQGIAEAFALQFTPKKLAEAQLLFRQAESQRLDNEYKAMDVHKARIKHVEWVYEQLEFGKIRKVVLDQNIYAIKVAHNASMQQICNGEAINVLIDCLAKNTSASVNLVPVPLEEDLLKHINAGTGKGEQGVHLGPIRNGKVKWITLLRHQYFAKEREAVDTALQKVYRELFSSSETMKPESLYQLVHAWDMLVDKLEASWQKAEKEWEMYSYFDARRFLRDNRKMIQDMAKDTGQLKYLARPLQGSQVLEFVEFMKRAELRVSACSDGDEIHYKRLYSALAKQVIQTYPTDVRNDK